MKNKRIMASPGFLISMQFSAQVVSKDLISTLKEQKESLQTSRDLNQQKMKLAKLENELAGMTQLIDKTAQPLKY